MKIEEATQTNDGSPVRIYATDGGGECYIHGAIWRDDMGWLVSTWDENGKVFGRLNSPNDLDLTDWKDEIPWEWLRDDIKWIARDRDGIWWGHTKEPILDLGSNGRWMTPEGYGDNLGPVKMPYGPTDWKQSKAERPEGK